ncbi:MAG: CvpA family protein [Holosporaceae bacterium]|jgi:membrane protein required for colicin V production|nr:CvpA family protein [Holosporaceae bacterium]
MKNEFFNVLDYFYIFLIFCSVGIGFLRGFVKDFFSTCAWVGGAFVTPLIAPYFIPFASSYFSNKTVAKCLVFGISYFTTLTALLLITSAMSRNVKGSPLSGVDRAGGALFGLFRGAAVLMCICVTMSVFEFPRKKYVFVKESKISTLLFDLSENSPQIKKLAIVDAAKGKRILSNTIGKLEKNQEKETVQKNLFRKFSQSQIKNKTDRSDKTKRRNLPILRRRKKDNKPFVSKTVKK